MVAKDIFPFATVTDGCKEANITGFSYYIEENKLTPENKYLPMNLAQQISFHILQSRFPESKI